MYFALLSSYQQLAHIRLLGHDHLCDRLKSELREIMESVRLLYVKF